MATKKPGTALQPWQAEMAAAAQKQAKAEKPINVMGSIKFNAAGVSVDGDLVKGGVLRVVAIAALHENAYYPGRYDPNSPTVPTCYAFSERDAEDPESTMAPSDDVEDQQATSCDGCEQNVFGSADTGKGKACKNTRRIAVVSEDALASAEAMKEAEVRIMKPPVTSVRNWSKYVHDLADDLNLPTFGVVTEVRTVPDPKSQFKVLFEVGEKIDFTGPVYAALKAKIAEVEKTLRSPYPKQAELDAQKAAQPQKMKPVGRVAQKAVAAKKGAAAPAKGRKY